ncbi:MAG TPA: DUF1800 domain-containing protein [Burkholderiaceae bacterium]|jgi:uncharacterized protein (DUF1800 family)
MSSSTPASLQAAIAAHRFGLGEASLDVVGGDPRAWLAAQIGPADAPRGDGLLSTAQALQHVAAERALRREAKSPPPGMTAAQVLAGHYREVAIADLRSRLLTAAQTTRPFAERLQWFWTNHFTVSLAKGSARGLVGAFERDAIRPNIAGSFDALLYASTTHPAMLRYLDNAQSAGPHSPIVFRAAKRAASLGESPRVTGLNENLAREVLELHTLGAESARDGVYTQADVTAFAGVLTGWRVALQDDGDDGTKIFYPAWHEPGPKSVLGKTYPEGPEALRTVLHDLARRPQTAQFIATKLARYVVDDAPPPALVERLKATYLRHDTQLAPVYQALIDSPEAWRAAPAKLKPPEEFVVSSARVLRLDKRLFDRGDGAGIAALGQRVQGATSPAGWSDMADDWLGPDAVWKRVEWSTRTANRLGNSLDARALAAQSLGPLLSPRTQKQLDRAADGSQALALLLMAPEFQRR